MAAEEPRGIRVRFRCMPATSAFYTVVSRGPKGERQYLQDPVLGMSLKQARKVWQRIVRQRDRSDEVAAFWAAIITLDSWEQGARTVSEACRLAGEPLEVFVEADAESTG